MESKRTPRRSKINGARQRLRVAGKEPGYAYRIVNDIDDRISEFQEDGWEIVSDNKVKIGDKRVSNPTAEGTPKQISVGGGVKAYLMRIKEEFYNEDQATKAEHLDKLEASMKKEALEKFGSVGGKLTITRD